MAKYLNLDSKGNSLGTTYRSKCENLRKDGAIELPSSPIEFLENLVCVVDNGAFAAAAYADTPSEMLAFKHFDGRPKKWFVYEYAKQNSK